MLVPPIFRTIVCRLAISALSLFGLSGAPQRLLADGPADNRVDQVRPIPPPGIEIPAEQMAQLKQRVELVVPRISQARTEGSAAAKAWLNDVEVLTRAVSMAIEQNQFYSLDEFAAAGKLLDLADARLAELVAAPVDSSFWKPSWMKQPGLLIGGYRSKLDDSIQPFSVVVPAKATAAGWLPCRLDVWLHGRDERVSEVMFLERRSKNPGEYAPSETLVLHPWGRYSNAFRFAGEVDVMEAIDEVKRRFSVDEQRISIRGFSMGGAGCWHLAAHYPDLWFAANPGAGFSETEDFLITFQKEKLDPPAYQRKMWNLHDSPPIANNFLNCPLIVYSGEIDSQKQAADLMAPALQKQGIAMTHIIGPQTAHKLHPDSKRIIEEQMKNLATIGREQVPSRVSFTTFSLRYHRSYWIDITGMEEHWRQATIDASLLDENRIEVTTTGVRSFEIDLAAGSAPFRNRSKPIDVIVDGVVVRGEPTLISSNRSFHAALIKDQDGWRYGSDSQSLRKRPGLQGPIDDAFLSRFLFVRPTGAGEFPEIDRWIQGELEHALKHWRIHFRGDIRIKNDTDVTDEDIAQNNLILFGTPKSNSVIAKCIDRLPLKWKTDRVAIGEQQYDAAFHVPVLVYPNPMATDRYIVLNSGFTYREYDYLNNARQTPKLPDWALIDIRQPGNARTPGGVVAADFFDEQWQVKSIK